MWGIVRFHIWSVVSVRYYMEAEIRCSMWGTVKCYT